MGLLTSGVTIVCNDRNRRGGIKTLFIGNSDQISLFVAGTDHEYTSVTMLPSTAKFFKFEFQEFEAEHTSDSSAENGSAVVEHTIEALIPKMEKVKAKNLQELVDSCRVIVIYENFNAKKFVVGFDQILGRSASLVGTVSEASGRALSDANGYTLTLTGTSGEISREFTGVVPI